MQPNFKPQLRVRRRSADRGLSTPLGVVLLVTIAILGSVAVVTVGANALDETRETSQHARVEQALTQFDSRQSVVALGEADAQTVFLSSSRDGGYTVEPDAGWLRIAHHDYDGSGANETIYNGSLGALVYRAGDTAIAHQGGGVWRTDGDGSVMIAPPEFHYQEETLVLPIVGVYGDDAVGGSARATVSPAGELTRVFPERGPVGVDGAGAPYDTTDNPYLNPVRGGTVTVTVHSEFYQAWGRFFEDRTEGSVTYDHSRRTATVELTAPRTLGKFDMPKEGNAIDVRGIPDGHAVDRFRIDLAPDDADAANFDNLQWSLYAQEGNQQLELHLRLSGPDDDKTTDCKEQHVGVTVYYSDRSGNPYHGWSNETAFRTTCIDRDGDGDRDEVRLLANLTGVTRLTFTDLESNDLMNYNTKRSDLADPVTFDQHEDEIDWEPITYLEGDEETIGNLIDHYFGRLGPDYNLIVDDKNSDSVSEEDSSGILLYEGKGRVTFMHITENGVRITLDGGGR